MKPRIVKTESGKVAENVSGSCAVLSIANCIGMSYENATKFAIKNLPINKVVEIDGQKHVSGVFTSRSEFTKGFEKLGRPVKKYEVITKDGASVNARLDTIVKILPKGRFLVSVDGHMVAVIDNKIVDNNDLGRTSRNKNVLRVFKVGNRGETELPESIELNKKGHKIHTFTNYVES